MKYLLSLLLIFITVTSCKLTTTDYRTGPIICLTFDDNDLSVYTQALPILQQYDFQASVFTNSGFVGNDGKLTWQQLTELDSLYHWEIGGHTYRHEHLQDLTYAEAELAIKSDYDTLCARGFQPVSFAVPRGVCPTSYYGIIGRYYQNIRRSLNLPLHAPIDKSWLGYFPYVMGFTANDMINRIKSGINNNEDLIILGFHGVNPITKYDTMNCPPEVFQEVVGYLADNGFRVMTLNTAVEYLK